MFWLIFSIVYIVGYLVTFRRIAGQYAWHKCANPTYQSKQGRSCPDGEQWAGGIFIGALAAIIWPISLPIAHGISSSSTGGRFFYIPQDVKETQYRKHIRELERAAGIR